METSYTEQLNYRVAMSLKKIPQLQPTILEKTFSCQNSKNQNTLNLTLLPISTVPFLINIIYVNQDRKMSFKLNIVAEGGEVLGLLKLHYMSLSFQDQLVTSFRRCK